MFLISYSFKRFHVIPLYDLALNFCIIIITFVYIEFDIYMSALHFVCNTELL